MSLPLRPVQGLNDPNQQRRDRETLNDILTFRHDDSRIRTPAEISAGVTPVNYAYAPGPIMDPRRYHALGTIGTAADDLASVNTALSVLKGPGSRGGTLLIPPEYSASMTLPSLGLSAGQAITIIDTRIDVISQFGAVLYYVEARDGSGGYASEIRGQGKQNPSVTLRPLSDGTAPGYPYANNMASFATFTNSGANNVQILTDPLAKGYVGDFSLYQYANGGSGSFAAYFGVDPNFKTKVDLTPINLASTTVNISSVTNTTPVVINTATPHGIVSTKSPISVAGVTSALNTSWLASVTGASQLTLLGSTAAGAFGAVGTVSVQRNAQRATLNVPAIQGGTEAIVTEGCVVSEVAQGTAPFQALSQTADTNLHACPYVVNINGTQQVGGTAGSGFAKIAEGNVSLSGGTATVTLSGNAVFTSTATYKVFPTNITNQANGVRATRSSGSQFTLTGTGTDSIDWIAVGF